MAVSILLLGIVFVVIMGGVGFLAFIGNRARKGYRLYLLADGRNPLRKVVKRFAIFSKVKRRGYIYTSPFALRVEKEVAYTDPNAWAFDKILLGAIGITGNPDDDNITFFSLPIISSALMHTNAVKLSESFNIEIKKILGAKELEKKKSAKDIVDFINDEYSKVINPSWFLKVFGIVDASDYNVILLGQRSIVEASQKIVGDFRSKHLSGWAKWQVPIILAVAIFVIMIALIPVLSSTLQYQQGLATGTQAFLDHICSLTHCTPATPNTIVTVINVTGKNVSGS